MLCCGLLPLIDKRHLGVYLRSCLRHGIRPLHPNVLIGNPIIVCTEPLFSLSLLSAWPLWYWEPSNLSYPLLWHNTKYCPQFVGHVWHLLHQDVVMNRGGEGPVPWCGIVSAQVSTDTFVTLWAWHVRIFAVSFWCSLASRCWPFGQRSPTWAWCCNISCRTNLWWDCTFSLCLQLNGPHCPYL